MKKINCPYCNGVDYGDVIEHPYPYTKLTKKLTQYINKCKCNGCNKHFFMEIRNGLDMGLDDRYYLQVYKQGGYQYKFTKNVVDFPQIYML